MAQYLSEVHLSCLCCAGGPIRPVGLRCLLLVCSTTSTPLVVAPAFITINVSPLLELTPSGLFMGLSSTIIYTSELILCFTICVPSATRHNIHMYPYFLFAAIHHLKSSPTFSVRPCSSVGRVTDDLIRRSWVRFPPRSKDFFFASCGSLFPFSRANAQWVIHGFK